MTQYKFKNKGGSHSIGVGKDISTYKKGDVFVSTEPLHKMFKNKFEKIEEIKITDLVTSKPNAKKDQDTGSGKEYTSPIAAEGVTVDYDNASDQYFVLKGGTKFETEAPLRSKRAVTKFLETL